VKYPAKAAQAVAEELVELLAPACEKIEVAGSLRRRRPSVSDVEIVFVPKLGGVKAKEDFFFTPLRANLAELQIEALLEMQVLAKRLNVKGHEAWGPKNKLAVHKGTGIPVDLFSATRDNFYNYLVCRTGPAQSNIAICNAAIAKGWKWNPYGDGFSAPPLHEGTKRVHLCSSEREVFEFVGLSYREPWER
jgi:DNA polymerase/3'-5' exonuclease PolX